MRCSPGLILFALGIRLLASLPPQAEREARLRMERIAHEAALDLPLPHPEIRIHKAAHTLELWASGRLLKRYATALGHRGLADKRREGDHLTPEGHFRLCVRNERSAFHLFLGVSYPGPEAAERGLKEGLITKAQHDRILQADNRGLTPPWNTRLGGTVGIHGGGIGKQTAGDISQDWTWGCIALDNADIEELWIACPLGTPILIEP